MWYWDSKYKVELVCNKREFYLYNWVNFFNKLWLYQLLSLLSIGHLTIIMSIIQFSHKYSDRKHVDPLSNLRREKLLICATTALKPGGNLGKSGESYGPWQLTTHWLRTPNQLLFFFTLRTTGLISNYSFLTRSLIYIFLLHFQILRVHQSSWPLAIIPKRKDLPWDNFFSRDRIIVAATGLEVVL